MIDLRVNRIALSTLFMKEIRRFTKVWLQTVMSPLVTTSLYFLVFGVALGSRLTEVDGVRYIEYVVPGLMMLSMINAAFLNASSSLFQSKINGTHFDLLVAPIGAVELLTAYVGASILRSLLVGCLVWGVAIFFTGFRVAHPLWVLYFSVIVAGVFALVGLLAAIYSQKFDHLAILPNFILTPLTFLGGVFYSVKMLPEPWATISQLNPIFYTVNGLRYGLLGVTDVAVWPAALAIFALFAVLLALAARELGASSRLRS